MVADGARFGRRSGWEGLNIVHEAEDHHADDGGSVASPKNG